MFASQEKKAFFYYYFDLSIINPLSKFIAI